MFYNLQTLTKGGPFYKCWLATSWPLKFKKLSPAQVRSVSVPELCTNLLEIINTEARNPSKRFSLRLSAQLYMGIVIIYQRQADLLMREAATLIFNVFRKPEAPSKKRPALPKPATVTADKDEVTITLPAEIQEIDVLATLNANMEQNAALRMQDITLRDEIIPPNRLQYTGFEDPPVPGKDNNMETMLEPNLLFEEQNSMMPLVINEEGNTLNNALIPEILITTAEKNMEFDETVPKPVEPNISTIQTSLVLEEYIPPTPKRNVKHKKVLKDDETQIAIHVMQKRIGKINCELRCSTAIDDRISDESLRPTADILFQVPASHKISIRKSLNCSIKLTKLFQRIKLIPDSTDQQFKNRTPQRVRKSKTRASLMQSYMENNLAVNDQTLLHASPLAKDAHISTAAENAFAEKTLELYDPSGNIEINITPINVTKRKSHSLALKRPSAEPVTTSPNKTRPIELPTIEEAPAINDVNENYVVANNNQLDETGLGSLDRTQVSLGDTSPSTIAIETEQFLNDEFGPIALSMKIFEAKRKGIRPLTLEQLVPKTLDPHQAVNCSRRRMAARAFHSLIYLKRKLLVDIKKKQNSSEIMHIRIHPETEHALRKKKSDG